MAKFSGFNGGEYQKLDLPPMFFADYLTQVDDLGELKVILFCLWALPQKADKYLTYDEFASHQPLIDGLKVIAPNADPQHSLKMALEKAVVRGALLHLMIELAEGEQNLYFLNTDKGRALVERIRQGEWQPHGASIEILPERPNIYKLYQDNIGALTPMIADDLKDAEREFSTEWIEEAISLAVRYNKRSIKYVRSILERWHKEGKHDGKEKRQEDDWRRYLYDEFGNPLK